MILAPRCFPAIAVDEPLSGRPPEDWCWLPLPAGPCQGWWRLSFGSGLRAGLAPLRPELEDRQRRVTAGDSGVQPPPSLPFLTTSRLPVWRAARSWRGKIRLCHPLHRARPGGVARCEP
jgi:hypothetical protein